MPYLFISLLSLVLANRLAGADAGSKPAPDPVIEISASDDFSCAVTFSGTAYCWGSNHYNQLGSADGTSFVPIPVTGLKNVISISTGSDHACAVTTAGQAWCWGQGEFGRLGDGDVTEHAALPRKVKGLREVRHIAAGDMHTCAASVEGYGYCWGINRDGQLGTKKAKGMSAQPVRLDRDIFVEQFSLSTSLRSSCAMTQHGRGYCWGDNDKGQLGTGVLTGGSAIPEPLAKLGALATISGRGSTHGCAVTQEGRGYCWGLNEFGILGTGGDTSHRAKVPYPVPIKSRHKFIHVAAGRLHTCGVAATHVVYCWGNNLYGELGNGTTENQHIPVRVKLKAEIVLVSAGVQHTCAVDRLGHVYCWGRGDYGQLGHGKYTKKQSIPVRVKFPRSPGR